MIETIYSNDSGETGRSGKVQTTFKMPKNIRQVGKSNANKKIYVEDYVMTFIKQLVGGDYSGCKVAVLVGQCVMTENCRNIFVSGAIEVNGLDTESDIVFSNDIWTKIYEDIKQYFVDAEIVGWFIGGPGYLLEDEEKIQKVHVDNFAGQGKVLLTYDNMEREEAFFSYENNRLCKQEGYYIYYEKNEEMQTYMINYKTTESAEASYDDKVSRDIRAVLQSKKPVEEESRSVTRLMYAAGTLLAIIILIVGAAILNNYDQMKSMQKTMNYLTASMQEMQAVFAENKDSLSQESASGSIDSTGNQEEIDNTSEDATDNESTDTQAEDTLATVNAEEQSLNVEIVPGEVKPLEENNSKEQVPVAVDQEDKKENENSDTGADLAEESTDNSKEEVKNSDTQKNTTETQNKVNYYVVENGDTLADISYKLYHTYTKVKTIMKLNGIEDQNFIYVGQKLIVP